MKIIATLALSLVIACSAFAQRTVTVNTGDVFTYPTATRLWGTNFSLLAWKALTNSLQASGLTLTYDATNRTVTVTMASITSSSISDSTSAGRALLTAIDATTQRSLLSAQQSNALLQAISDGTFSVGDLLVYTNGAFRRIAHPGSSGKSLISTNSPSGGLMWADPPAGSGTVTSVGGASTVSGLSFSNSPVTSSGTLTLTGTVAAASIDSVIARIASPAFTGDPTGPTASPGDSDTSLATTAFIQAALTAWTNWTAVTIGTLNVSTNLTVGDVAYGAGWNGSTNVPSMNAVYDEMELRATKSSPSFTGAATNTGSFGAPLFYVGSTNLAAEVALKAPLVSPAFTGTATNTGSFGSPVVYIGSTNVAAELALKANAANASMTGAATNTGSFGAPTLYVGTTNVAVALASASTGPTRSAKVWVETDYLTGLSMTAANVGLPNWQGAALVSGSLDVRVGEPNHPGIVRWTSGAGGNSGYYQLIDNASFLLSTNYYTEIVFRPHATNVNSVTRYGWHDSTSTTAPTDGLFLVRSNNIIRGVEVSNGTLTNTPTTYSISTNTWYNLQIAVNSTATVGTFTLKSETGSTLWTDGFTNGLPTGANRWTGHGVISWVTDATAIVIEDVDYMGVGITGTVTR